MDSHPIHLTMKELLEALSVAMIAEGTDLANTGARMNSHDAATASMLKGFGRALERTAFKLSKLPCQHPSTIGLSAKKGCTTATCKICGMGLELDERSNPRKWIERPDLSIQLS